MAIISVVAGASSGKEAERLRLEKAQEEARKTNPKYNVRKSVPSYMRRAREDRETRRTKEVASTIKDDTEIGSWGL